MGWDRVAGVTRQMNLGASDRRPCETASSQGSKQWRRLEVDGFEILLLKVGTTGFSDRWKGKKESVMTPRFSVKQLSGRSCHLQRQERFRGRVAGGGC